MIGGVMIGGVMIGIVVVVELVIVVDGMIVVVSVIGWIVVVVVVVVWLLKVGVVGLMGVTMGGTMMVVPGLLGCTGVMGTTVEMVVEVPGTKVVLLEVLPEIPEILPLFILPLILPLFMLPLMLPFVLPLIIVVVVVDDDDDDDDGLREGLLVGTVLPESG